MQAREIFGRVSAAGASAQAIVPGLYAWGVTVAPAAWGRGAPMVARLAAVVAVVALCVGSFVEPRWGQRARVFTLWAFVLGCALAWSAAPGGLAPLHVDTTRGLAGMLGWGLYALASAAPALASRREPDRLVDDDSQLAPRRGLRKGDAIYVAFGTLAAMMLQTMGWKIAVPERALLLRLVALAAGLALVGASVEVALTRHVPRQADSAVRRLRRGLVSFLILAGLGLVGVYLMVRE